MLFLTQLARSAGNGPLGDEWRLTGPLGANFLISFYGPFMCIVAAVIHHTPWKDVFLFQCVQYYLNF